MLVKRVLPFILCLLPQLLLAQAPVTKVWDKTYGGSSIDDLTVIITTTDGGYLLGGNSRSGISGDKTEPVRGIYGEDDYWVVKLRADGSKAWDRTYGCEAHAFLTSIVQTADGGYLLGGHTPSAAGGDKTEERKGNEFNSDCWIVKLNADGSKAWDKTIGGSKNDVLNSILITPDGGFLLGGSSTSEANYDKTEAAWSGSDFWIIKLSSDGTKIWDRTIGGFGDDELYTMVQTQDGGFLIGGSSGSNAGGDKSENRVGSHDYWIVKINAEGRKIWDKTYGGNDMDILRSIITTQDGGFLLGGRSFSGAGGDKTEGTRGWYDYWVVKIDAAGTKHWDKTYGGNYNDYFTSFVRAHGGGYLLGGWSQSGAGSDKTEGNGGYWLVKINSDGSKAWDKVYASSNRYVECPLVTTTDGAYLFGGSSNVGVSIYKSEPSRGEVDYWVAKIKETHTLNTALPQQDTQHLVVYPNPGTGNLKVEFPNINFQGKLVELVLFNALGKEVLRQQINGEKLKEGAVLLSSDIQSGSYFLQVQAANKILTKKVILY